MSAAGIENNARLVVYELSKVHELSPSSVEGNLLDQGWRYASSASETPGWRWTSHSKFDSFDFTLKPGHAFVYAPNPPLTPSQGESSRPISVPLWDTSAGIRTEDPFDFNDMESFVSTRLDVRREGSSRPMKRTRHNRRGSSPLPKQITKRPKVDLPILSLLPYPHYIPYPFHTSVRPRTASARVVTPVHPHTATTIYDMLSEAFCRLAWIVPLRGTIQLHKLTPASLLQDGLPVDGSSLEIAWTRSSVRQFWSFLKGDIQNGAYGEVSLSFHPVTKPSIRQPSFTSSSGDPVSHSTSTLSSITSPTTRPSSNSFNYLLRSTDYIEIYCQAQRALDVRRAIETWTFDVSEEVGLEGRAIQVLKGARLVLVDGRNSPVLVS